MKRSFGINIQCIIYRSGTSDAELTKLQLLLTNVAKLEEAKPNKQLKSLYARKDKDEAEAERSRALVAVEDSSDDEPLNQEEAKKDGTDDFDFESESHKGRFQNSNPKQQLVKYLESKSDVL